MSALEDHQIEIQQTHDGLVQQLGLHLQSENEDFVRFSESPIWALQRQYFCRQGVNAWRGELFGEGSNAAQVNALQLKLEPFHQSSNPFMADAYADIVLAYWEDAIVSGQLDIDLPTYFLELGSGSGAFSYHLLNALNSKLEQSAIAGLKWTLLASDISQKNLNFIQGHPDLIPFIQEGKLDTVLFDAELDSKLHLQNQNIIIDQTQNPLCVVANSVFDGLTQELFYIHYGKLFEGKVAVNHLVPETDELADKNEFEQRLYQLQNPFENVVLSYDWQASSIEKVLKGYSMGAKHVELIPDYVHRLDSTPLLMPSGALHCVDQLRTLSDNKLLLLTADKGPFDERDLRMQCPPQLDKHGSFSLPVNFHMLERHCQQVGGLNYLSSHRDDGLVFSVSLFNDQHQYYGNTESWIHKRLNHFSPDDSFTLRQILKRVKNDLSSEEMLSYLRLSQYDVQVLDIILPVLLKSPLQLSVPEREAWCEALNHVWKNVYPLGTDFEKLFDFGVLLIELAHWSLAKAVFQMIDYFEIDNASVKYNQALIELHLGQKNNAHQLLTQSLRFDSSSEQTKKLFEMVDGELEINSRLPWYQNNLAEDELLILEPLSKTHTNAFFHQYRDPHIGVLTRLPNFEALSDLETWIEEERETQDKATFAVMHKTQGFAGVVSMRLYEDKAYFYFWIGADFQNQGLGQRAANLVFKQAENLNIKKIFTSAYVDNARSRYSLNKLGFEQLDINAEAPDEELLFYLRANEGCCRVGDIAAANELDHLLRAIQSPIRLVNVD